MNGQWRGCHYSKLDRWGSLQGKHSSHPESHSVGTAPASGPWQLNKGTPRGGLLYSRLEIHLADTFLSLKSQCSRKDDTLSHYHVTLYRPEEGAVADSLSDAERRRLVWEDSGCLRMEVCQEQRQRLPHRKQEDAEDKVYLFHPSFFFQNVLVFYLWYACPEGSLLKAGSS